MLSILVAAKTAATSTQLQQGGVQPHLYSTGSRSESTAVGQQLYKAPAYQRLLQGEGLSGVRGSCIKGVAANDVTHLLDTAAVVLHLRVRKLQQLCAGSSTTTTSSTSTTATSTSSRNHESSAGNNTSAVIVGRLFDMDSRAVLPMLPAVVAELLWLHAGDAQVTAAGLRLITQVLQACAAIDSNQQQQQSEQQQSEQQQPERQQSEEEQPEEEEQQQQPPRQQQLGCSVSPHYLRLLLPVVQSAVQQGPGSTDQLGPAIRDLLQLCLFDEQGKQPSHTLCHVVRVCCHVAAALLCLAVLCCAVSAPPRRATSTECMLSP